MRAFLIALALLATAPAYADEASDEAALTTRLLVVSDAPELLRAGVRRSVERAIGSAVPDITDAERVAMTSQVAAILAPIVERRRPGLETSLKTALAGEFSAPELQQLIDLQVMLKRPDVEAAVEAARRAPTAGARVQALASLPREDFQRVMLALGSPLAQRLETTLRNVVQSAAGDFLGEAFAALGQACEPATGAPPRWCAALTEAQ